MSWNPTYQALTRITSGCDVFIARIGSKNGLLPCLAPSLCSDYVALDAAIVRDHTNGGLLTQQSYYLWLVKIPSKAPFPCSF